MMSNRLTIKGQVTIPKAVRDFLGLQEGGSSVEFTINDDGSVTPKLPGMHLVPEHPRGQGQT